MSLMKWHEKPASLKLKRGTVLWGAPSCADPAGTDAVVICEKHGTKIPFTFSLLTENRTIAEAAHEALDTCEGCQHEADHKASRFPEGAEL